MAWLRDYLSFSKRERTGVITLITLIMLVFIAPEFVRQPKTPVDPKAAAEFREQIASLKWSEEDSSASSRVSVRHDDIIPYGSRNELPGKEALFQFDPNTLGEDGWKRLGISNRTVSTIKKYLSKGGQFREPEDIGKIYGLRKEQYHRLLPYVVIQTPVKLHKDYHNNENEVEAKPEWLGKTKNKVSIIDLNAADTSMLIALPGIGSKLANRIISFRNKLGGFYTVDQVKEIYGLPDSTFQNLKSLLRCDSSGIQQLNINTVDLATLKNHPYIKWNIANAIINYRQQHGNFYAIEDLLKINIISRETLTKLFPYLKVN